MAVQKSKVSIARRGSRRSHDALPESSYQTCPSCGELKRKHHVCLSCGQYRNRAVFEKEQ